MPKQAWHNRIVGTGEESPDQLLANPRNFRVHPKHQQDALEGVLNEVGWVDDVIVNQRTGFVIDGHLRVSLAQRRGEMVPVKYVDLDEHEEALILATFDPISALAATDAAQLDALLREVSTSDAAVMQMLSDLAEREGVIGFGESEAGLTDPDEVPEPPSDPITKPGDMWILGRHRLLCGDSTKREDVDRLMNGEKADVCLTDPPYGLGDSATIKNNYGDYVDTKENLAVTIDGFFPIAQSVALVVVITPGNANQRRYAPPDWTMAWFTPAGVGSGPWGFCCWQPILCYGKDPKLSKGKGRHPDAIVHTESADDVAHPCPKPTKFWSWLMDRVSEAGCLIYEPFAGSGTSHIAAEAIDRTCYGMELDPHYCDVIVQRWENFTGQQAHREADSQAVIA